MTQEGGNHCPKIERGLTIGYCVQRCYTAADMEMFVFLSHPGNLPKRKEIKHHKLKPTG